MSIEYELPPGWMRTTLGAITKINPRVDISILPDSTVVSFVPMAAVEAESGRMDASKERRLDEVKRGYTAFQEGDVLFAKITPCMENGKFAIAKSLISNIGFGSTEFHVMRSEEGVDPGLIFYYLVQQSFRQSARSNMTGSAGQLRVPAVFLANASYPLPPINEQHRIVAAIEQQFSRLDAAVTSLQHARAKLKRQRAAILKAAVEGTLTADWRAQHPASETAEQLLQRILDERRAKWEADQLAKMQARSVTPKDDKWKDAYKEPEQPETTNLPELPEGWIWGRAEQLCEFISKGTTPAAEKLFGGTGEIPFIKVYNLTNRGLLDFSVNPTFVDQQTHSRELARSKVFPGDVLMNIVGPPLGKVAIIPNMYPEWNINQAIAFFRPLTDYKRKLLCYSLLTEEILSWAKSRAKATAGQFNLTLEICRDLPLPLPPADEQLQIVEEIELQLSVVDELEVVIAANLKRAERLRQTILAEAFAGRLVPQHPGDEPASVLLERIRGERRERDGMQKKGRAGNGRARAAMRVSGEPVKIDVEGMEQVALWESK